MRVCYSILIKTVYTKSGSAFLNSVNSSSLISGVILLVIQLHCKISAVLNLCFCMISCGDSPHVVSPSYDLETAKRSGRTETVRINVTVRDWIGEQQCMKEVNTCNFWRARVQSNFSCFLSLKVEGNVFIVLNLSISCHHIICLHSDLSCILIKKSSILSNAFW